MAGLFDYTQPNLPLNSFLLRQGQDLPPDAAQQNLMMTETPQQTAQTQNTSGVPAYLTPNPADPDAPVPPSALDAYLHMNQAVQPYHPAPRQDPQFAAYDRMAKTAAGEQWAGIDQLQKYIEDMKGQPQGINLSPLAAYIDAHDPTGKSHLLQAAQAMAPMTPEQKQQHIMDLQFKLQGDRNTLATGQLSALGKQIEMQKNAETMQHLMNMDKSNQQRSQSYVDRVNLQRDNQTNSIPKDAAHDLLLTQYSKQYNQIAGIDQHTLEASNEVPTQIMDEIAGGIANALQGGKGAGLEQTKMQQLSSVYRDYQNVKSYAAGKPYNSLTSDQKDFLNGTLGRLKDAYQVVMAGRYKQVMSSRNYQYNPAANQMVQNTGAQYGVPVGTLPAPGVATPELPHMGPSGGGSPDYNNMSDAELLNAWKQSKGIK